jgi:hypothetical protein
MANRKVAKPASGTERHRSHPVNITPVPNYPKKLVVYQLQASPYWWVRYYVDGKIIRRSTKETAIKEAFASARAVYVEINYKRQQGQALNSRMRSPPAPRRSTRR